MKILLARTGGLGDSILTLPVAHHINTINPYAELHVLGNETMLAVARISGVFRGFRSIEESGFSGLYMNSGPSDFIRSCFSDFDEVYFFSAGDKENITHNIVNSGVRKYHIFDPGVPRNLTCHITEYLMKIFDGLEKSADGFSGYGIKIKGKPEIYRNGIVIHPGSGSKMKNWPLDKYLLVVEKITTKTTFLLGPAEIERGMRKDISCSHFHIVCPKDIEELYRLISGASIYIGNDSGVSHLAAWCGIPAVVLFGPTNPEIWKPLGRNVTVLMSKDSSMNGITVDEVLTAIENNRP